MELSSEASSFMKMNKVAQCLYENGQSLVGILHGKKVLKKLFVEMLSVARIAHGNKQYGQDFHENEQSTQKLFIKRGSLSGISH